MQNRCIVYLCQDTFFVGNFKGVGKVYLQTVVDTYGSYAFGYLHTGKMPEHAATILGLLGISPFEVKNDIIWSCMNYYRTVCLLGFNF